MVRTDDPIEDFSLGHPSFSMLHCNRSNLRLASLAEVGQKSETSLQSDDE